MSNTREIVTLQIGHYANFVGTHFWNTQEASFNYTTPETEINHDVLYREGLTSKGVVTYTPRTLLIDLKGSLKHLREDGSLYSEDDKIDETTIGSETKIEKIQTAAIEVDKNTFQQSLEPNSSISPATIINLDNEIDVWSDFLYSRFHPRTFNIVNEYQHNDTQLRFDTFPCGSILWKEKLEEDFLDRIRLYSEECDNMQGFHMFCDSTDAFSGLAASCIDSIRDDYENKSILTIPLIDTSQTGEHNVRRDVIKQINIALALSKMYESSSLIVPMSVDEGGWRNSNLRTFKYINYNNEFKYHTSAILASAIDTFSLRYRNKNTTPSYLFHLCNDLNSLGRKIVAASLNLPFPIKANEPYLIDCLNSMSEPLYESLTPRCKISNYRCMQSLVLRGVPEARLKHATRSSHREMPAYKCQTVKDMLEFYLSCNSYATASYVTTITKPLNVKLPFPNFFTNNINLTGDVTDQFRDEKQYIETVSVLSGLHSVSGVGDMLEVLHRETGRIKINNFNEFRAAGMEEDIFKAQLEELLNMRECYIEEHYL